MKKYIVITPSGYCEDMNNNEAAHCQVIVIHIAQKVKRMHSNKLEKA